MKDLARVDYSLSAGAYAEEYPEFGELLDGCVWLAINDVVRIAFVSGFAPGDCWERPADLDEPASRAEAISIAAHSAPYIVIESTASAGQERAVRDCEGDETFGCFFVSRHEYQALARDVSQIAAVSLGCLPARHFRRDFVAPALVAFIEGRFAASPLLQPYTRRMLRIESPRAGGAPT
ncbi:MAG: hypothetical protein R3B06_14380 [Kofleriaceae bacterium]